MPARDQWTGYEARRWYAGQPWLVGCNFIPSNAVNQLEMWQAETFDIETTGHELGWAADVGFNTVRVFLHDLLWQQDAKGFLGRVDRFLEVAEGHGIRPMFVLFDGVWDPQPRLGRQRAPRPRVHNSGWVQSPGAEVLGDASRRAELEGYVSGVVGHLRDDERVVAWDLFNEPDSPNPAYRGARAEGQGRARGRAVEPSLRVGARGRAGTADHVGRVASRRGRGRSHHHPRGA